jgi:hypothetical protein
MTVNLNELFDHPDNYSLVEVAGDPELNFSDEYEIPTLFSHSPYFDDTGFIDLMKEKAQSFKVLSLNCQSINAKINELRLYLNFYEMNNITISAICLQETWLGSDFNQCLLEFDNYNFISKGKHCSTHGGVAIYLHKSFDYNILPIGSSDLWDGLFLEIFTDKEVSTSLSHTKLILGNIYRPPRNNVENIDTFISETNLLFEKLQRFKNVLLGGDFNLDLLKCKESQSVNNYFEHLLSHGYIPKISFPTSLTHRHGTLIDNFLIKISDNFSETTSGIILKSISLFYLP